VFVYLAASLRWFGGNQGPVGDLLQTIGRHNIRPNHLHMMIDAPGFRKLTTALYPEGDAYLASDPVFGVKKSLVVVSRTRLLSGEWID
jgi:protocatechuate 3,4-dioxygenase beta subunit